MIFTRDEQRLGIAIALIAKPDFLILDEPINGLDPVGIKEFRQMIKRLNDELGMTILIPVTSSPNFILGCLTALALRPRTPDQRN